MYVEESDEAFEFNADIEGFFDRDLLSTTLQFDVKINDSIDFVSITNYMDMDKTYGEDTDGLASGFPAAVFDTFYLDNDGEPITVQSFFPDQPSGADLGEFNFRSDQEFSQISQEFRFSGGTDSLLWQAGFYYLDIDTENEAEAYGLVAWWTGGPASNFQPSQRIVSNWDVTTETLSVFGQVDFLLSENLTLTAGLRWTEDDKENDFYARYETKDGVALLEEVDTGTSFPIQPVCYSDRIDDRCQNDARDGDAQDDYSDWAGKLQLDWNISEDVLAYFGISKGIKGGNWSAPALPDAINLGGIERLAHDEETLYAYEGGLKSTLSGGLLRINVAAFYYDYQDYQAFSLINFNQNISNNDAEVTGAELEIFASPWEGWDFMLGAAFLDTDVEGVETPTGLFIDTEMPQAPEFSANGLARYEFPVGTGSMAAQIDFTYTGEHWMEVTNAPVDEEDTYFLANARLSYYSSEKQWRVAAWVKNIGDEEYRIYALDVAGAPSPFINDVYGSPRTYGLTVAYTFE
ncbi:MAG: iron complex outermembrane receptor protein [Halieaceae bacterium]